MEALNRFLYDTRPYVLRIVRSASAIATFVAIGLILYLIGFPADSDYYPTVFAFMEVIFGVFAISYFVKLLYSFERRALVKESWIEAIVMLLIASTGIAKLFFDHSILEIIYIKLDLANFGQFYYLFVTIFMGYLIAHKFVRASNYIHYLAVKPAVTFIGSFMLLIMVGTSLLMLPEMSTQVGGASFMDSFFTGVSASCVTGLIIVDTATFWTFKGQIVILFLMQFGGIGIVSFATFFSSFMREGMGIKQQVIIQDFLSTDSLFSAKNMLRQVIGITISFEVMAAVAIFFSWGNKVAFDSIGQEVFYSIFHAVSAFCNAGFSLFSNGLYESEIQGSLLLHVIIGCTVIIGGFGFSTIQDVFSPKKLRERLENPWKDWKLSSKISIYTSGILIAVGLVLFFVLERNNATKEMGNFEALVASFFQSVTTRTAGFNTVDMSNLLTPTLIFMIIWMFIGASSGSTGGGIKTSTFLLITVSSIATIRGKKSVDLGKRHITNELLFKAFSVFAFAIFYNLIMIFVLSIFEPNIDIIELAFEQISAFATVGLSTGITDSLSTAAQGIIICSMFVGRIGTLTLALALSTRVSTTNYKYPNEHLLIG